MDLPILQYSPDGGDGQLLDHQMTADEQALFSELDAAAAAVGSDELDAIYEVIIPLGAGHGLSAQQTIAFWTRATFRTFEPDEVPPTEGAGEPPEQFSDLMFEALDHGFDVVKDGKGPVIPFALVLTNGGERHLQVFLTEPSGDGVRLAQDYVCQQRAELWMYAIAWDGYVTVDDTKWDAVVVEAGMADRAEGVLICQRYKTERRLFRKRNVPVGNPAIIDRPPSRVHRTPEPDQ